MKPYGDLSGNSGVVAFLTHGDAIDVLFKDDNVYRYDGTATGRDHVETMKQLAQTGNGLASYINRHREVREGYAAKWTLDDYRAMHRKNE